MYGLINQGIKDLVVQVTDEPTWQKMCLDANLPSEFVSHNQYDDAITYKLVEVVSKQLQMSKEDVLAAYGRHWIKYTAKEGFGPLMDLFGKDFKSCLLNLNHLHTRMGLTMPHLSPPSFEFKEISSDEYTVEYISKRKGLAPMVVGLLQGLATKYGHKVDVSFTENENSNIFKIKLIGRL